MTTPQNRSRFWTFLSLWSLLALAAPQLLWACPMMGKVASSSMGKVASSSHAVCCCPKAPQAGSAKTNLAKPDNADRAQTCCKQVPLPASDTSGEDSKVALSSGRIIADSVEHFLLFNTPALLPSLDNFELQPTSVAFSPPTSFSLTSQHARLLSFGRAPPF